MLTHPTLALLTDLGLHGMAAAFKDLHSQPEARALEHGDWLALLLEREATLRCQKRFESRARAARLRPSGIFAPGRLCGRPGALASRWIQRSSSRTYSSCTALSRWVLPLAGGPQR